MEVIKIRLQAQNSESPQETLGRTVPKHRNGLQLFVGTLRTEGLSGLYRGISLTALRQGSNQAVSFTTYTYTKGVVHQLQPQYEHTSLPSWQTTLIGLLSGVMGPLSNQPIDTIKTKLQSISSSMGSGSWTRVRSTTVEMLRLVIISCWYLGALHLPSTPSVVYGLTGSNVLATRRDGLGGFYRGILPRIMRVAPGQAITFTVYEFLNGKIP